MGGTVSPQGDASGGEGFLLQGDPGGHIVFIGTDRPAYDPNATMVLNVTVASEGKGEGLDGQLDVFVVADADPLGSGDRTEEKPVFRESRDLKADPDPDAPVSATAEFQVALPPATGMFYAGARWRPAGVQDFGPLEMVRFGIRPALRTVPSDILTFQTVVLDPQAVRDALRSDATPTPVGECQGDITFPPGFKHANDRSENGQGNVEEHNKNAEVDKGDCTGSTAESPAAVELPLGAGRLVRVNYFEGRFLAPSDFTEEQRFYRGTVEGTGIRSRLSLDASGIFASFRAPDGSETVLEPLFQYDPNAPADRYIAYHSNAVLPPQTIHDKWTPDSGGPPEAIGESHLTDADLYRVLRLGVWKDDTSFAAMHHVWDVAEVFETDLKVIIEPTYMGTVDSDGYSTNTCGGDPSFLWSFRRDVSSSGFDARILFTNNPSYNYGTTLGCGGGSGSASTRAAYVVHTGTNYQIQQVAAQELGHALGASHDCASTYTHAHFIPLEGIFGGLIWLHDHMTIMCGTYPGDANSAKVFSAFSVGETEADAHNLPFSMHYWTGESDIPLGLSLREFWMRHASNIPLIGGTYTAGYTVVNEAGVARSFFHFHLAFDPEGAGIQRVRKTGYFTLPSGWSATYSSGTGVFPGVTIFNVWTGGEVWPSYRLDDGHAHVHYGPDEWNGVDFEL